MIFPKHKKDNITIGVTACSSGVLDKIEKYEDSINNVEENGFNIVETDNVRASGVVSSSNVIRWNELKSLYLDNNIDIISIASGGDFLIDMLSLVDYDLIKDNVKWICGSSDPTSLLFIITTKLDIATIYSPCNMSGFNIKPLHKSYLNYFEILKGNYVRQDRFPKCENESFSDILDKDNEWNNINGNVDETGTLIGGCIECLKDIIGTKYDNTKEFINKHDNIIWYFDVFNMTSEGLYNTLIQFRDAGWFNNTKAILIGKVCFPNSYVEMSYEELISKAIPDIKVIYNFDVGHVKPSFTMINGANVRIVSNEKEGYLEYLDK